NWRMTAPAHATSAAPVPAPRSCGRARPGPRFRSARAREYSFEDDHEALVALALVFRPGDAHAAAFTRVGDVGAAISLLIDTLDVDDANLSDTFGDEIDFRPNQVGNLKRLQPRQDPHCHGMSLPKQLVGSLLDLCKAIRR